MAIESAVPTVPGPQITSLPNAPSGSIGTGTSPGAAVNVPSKSARAFLSDCALTDALMGGTEAMRLCGPQFLPREPAESLEAYRLRTTRSFLFGGFRKTVDTLVGKAFRLPVTVGPDVPAPLATWAANIDLTGRDISTFAKDVLTDAVASGISYIYVDHPPFVPGSTLADERARGDRPYMVHVRAADILGIRSDRVAGIETITRVRILERACGYAGPWDDDGALEQIRVLELGRWQVWRQRVTGDRDWFVHDEGMTSLPYVPLFPVYGKRTGFCDGRSPMMDLAWLNLAHWQSYSDYRNILRIVSVGFLFGGGIPAEDLGGKLEIGPNRILVVSDPKAHLGYVEHTGAGIGSLKTHLDDLKADMAVLGAEMLVRNVTSGRTATQANLDAAEMHSVLAAIVAGLSQTLGMAAQAMADFARLADGGTWTVSNEFTSVTTTATDLAALLALRSSGEISQLTLFAELKRRGLLDDSFDAADEVKRLAAEPPDPALEVAAQTAHKAVHV